MTYGNRLFLIIVFLLVFLCGCEKEKNFSYSLYDGYIIRKVDNTIKLYKDKEVINIQDLDYKIKEVKYNSDVVCLKLQNNDYYMIYYFDSSIYGPYTLETLNETTNGLSMTFNTNFKNISKVEGLVYE